MHGESKDVTEKGQEGQEDRKDDSKEVAMDKKLPATYSLLRRGSMGRYVYPLNEVSAGAKAERVD